MQRHLFAVAACIILPACVVQPLPGYWGTSASPYPQASPPRPYAPGPYAQGPYAQGPYSQDPYAQSWRTPTEPLPPYATRPRIIDGPPEPSDRTPEDSDSGPDLPGQPLSGSNSAPEPRTRTGTFADEMTDYGVPPTNTLRRRDFDAPTPTHVQGARTIATNALRQMLHSDRPPLLVDVMGGEHEASLPGAVWLRDAGVGRHLDDDVQAWLDHHLSGLTGRDKSRPVVFFCASRMCWLAHNATLRALDLGYTNVYWYRGGRDAWQAAGLPMEPVTPPPT